MAYAPYSQFQVGAGLLVYDEVKKKTILFSGCNIEHASYGGTVCAERVAAFKAVSEGYRNFLAVCVFVDTKNVAVPCAFCLGVLTELSMDQDIPILLANKNGIVEETLLSQLLPRPFRF